MIVSGANTIDANLQNGSSAKRCVTEVTRTTFSMSGRSQTLCKLTHDYGPLRDRQIAVFTPAAVAAGAQWRH